MTLLVAPKAALAPTQPGVGIFWRVNGILVIDRSTLDEAEPYGDCLTHRAGHYERWQGWQALGIAGLASNPRPHNSEKLAGYDDRYRVRQGHYRIVYLIDDSRQEVTIFKVGHRKDVYRR